MSHEESLSQAYMTFPPAIDSPLKLITRLEYVAL